jgi:hypothetical protein
MEKIQAPRSKLQRSTKLQGSKALSRFIMLNRHSKTPDEIVRLLGKQFQDMFFAAAVAIGKQERSATQKGRTPHGQNSRGWQVHAFCLMNNHFHLVVETPQPNLAAGMKWFLGTYTNRYNRCCVRWRLRSQTTMTLKRIAQRLKIGA